MRLMLCVMAILFMGGCAVGPTKEAADVSALGVSEVAKLRLLADRHVDRDFDQKVAAANDSFAKAWKKAQDAAGKVSAEFALAAIAKRDAWLAELESLRSQAHAQASGLHENAMKANAGIWQEWEAEGKLTAGVLTQFQDLMSKGMEMYADHERAKRAEKEAKRAAEAAAATEGGE